MKMIDSTGHRVSGANAKSLQMYEQAARELLCMVDDPVASVEAAIAASPEMTMGHVLNAWLNLLGTEPSGIAPAHASLDVAERLDADERERAHIDAARALANGRWQEAGFRLEDLSVRFPRDTLALQVGHQIDFFRGDSRMLRDRIARALPAWDASVPGWHAVLGMHAFGLEETADYQGAEAQGRRAVEAEPRDSWAWHAVAHVHEMRNATRAGIEWLAPTRNTWAQGSFLATHNSWHLALFYLEQDRHDEVLRLYDEAIGGTGSELMLDLIDASAMLWRLHLRGVAVGDRFDAIANRWAAAHVAGQYAFNDLHAMIAFVGAGRAQQEHALIEAMRAACASDVDNAMFTRDVGLPASHAIQAFGRGDFARATQLLRSIRSGAHRFGGSHAQRDLIDLTLLEAARRAGDRRLAAALAAERSALKPRSPLVQRMTATSRIAATLAAAA
ncbi:MAG: tetratricopeptide repeat protein [Candidatus Accumulibacter meliphilus]|jgi:tetratricopeptide (TPR) repeat protein|uniref:Tetratricopeptide repeat protein 38 n=1 Tax=Candidatus Accumulibacter meliphilus TaxID=2211374 RepID=A0A369XPU8_9PROT|nr:MAG: tetratricopeptide repeat protein [Candidatus Accumulibacter meliphilus]